MKVGNIVNSLEVIDVKRVNKMNIIQFTKAVSEYIDQGYKIDVNSARQIGLVLQVDVFKTEEPKPYEGSVAPITEASLADEEGVETLDETEYLLSSETNKQRLLESVDRIKQKTSEGEVSEVSEVSDEETPVKKPTQRSKKTT